MRGRIGGVSESVIVYHNIQYKTTYDTAGTISKKEAENAVERAEKIVREIERRLRR